MEFIFETIINYPKYEICREGIVRNRRINGASGILKPQMVNEYMCYRLYKDTRKGERIALHRLLGIQFIPNPENKPVIDHINRDKLDNRLENLRWATIKENSNNRDNIRTAEYWTEYKREKQAKYRANYTEDKKVEVLAKKREAYNNETQKEYVNRPEVKERRLAEQTRKRLLVKAFSVLPFAKV